MITIGNLAKTFHILPSVVRDTATTYDVMIADVMITWEQSQKNPQDQALYQEQDLINLVKRTQ